MARDGDKRVTRALVAWLSGALSLMACSQAAAQCSAPEVKKTLAKVLEPEVTSALQSTLFYGALIDGMMSDDGATATREIFGCDTAFDPLKSGLPPEVAWQQREQLQKEQRAKCEAQHGTQSALNAQPRITVSAIRFRGRGKGTDRVLCAARVTAAPQGSPTDRADLDFEITYSVEATEDGESYVTILSADK